MLKNIFLTVLLASTSLAFDEPADTELGSTITLDSHSSIDPCIYTSCGPDQRCVYEPKQCITEPCLQYRCEPIEAEPLPSEKPGSCPKPGLGVCVESCSNDYDCKGADKCCYNGCGHVCTTVVAIEDPCAGKLCAPDHVCVYNPDLECANCDKTSCVPIAVGSPQPGPIDPCATVLCAPGHRCIAEPKQCFTEPCEQYRCELIDQEIGKPGLCPKASGFGICVEACTSDFDCKDDDKCCSNGCGHVCMSPVFIQPDPCDTVLCLPGHQCIAKIGQDPICVPNVTDGPNPLPEDPCIYTSCGPDERCVWEPKQCITTPCPQHRCEPIEDPCATVDCAPGNICVPQLNQECINCPKAMCVPMPSPPQPDACALVRCASGTVCIVDGNQARCVANEPQPDSCADNHNCGDHQLCVPLPNILRGKGNDQRRSFRCIPRPVAVKLGHCPKPDPNIRGICVEACSTDADCKGADKCCSNGCGHVCTKPTYMIMRGNVRANIQHRFNTQN